jgi:FAD/FMN-containing dehydrogenase
MDLSSLRVNGAVLTPDDAGFVESCVGFNRGAERRPDVVVRPAGVEDVVAAVRFADERDLPLAVIGSGHHATRTMERGVLIVTDALDEVSVDANNRSVTVGAGARWGQVVPAAAEHGLAPMAGSSGTVGVAGYCLGGGLSPILGRRYGWASDHVLSIELVTASGELRTVTATSDPDLFWALRGGGSNFGVVTALTLALLPLTQLHGGSLFFEGADATRVVEAFQRVTAAAPDELTVSFAFLRFPAAPGFPELLAGRFVVHLRVAFLGGAADADTLIAPLRAAATPLLDTVRDMPVTEFAQIHQDPPNPLPFSERSTLLRELPGEALTALLELAGSESRCPITILELRHLAGAYSRAPEQPSAADHRDAAFSVWAIIGGPPTATGDAQAYADRLVERMAPSATGRQYLGFMPDNAATAEGAFEPEAWERLRAIKRVADPKNLFRLQHAIDG